MIPIKVIVDRWEKMYIEDLELDNLSFTDIVSWKSTWRKSHSDHYIMNTFMKMSENEDLWFVLRTITNFLLIFRLIMFAGKNFSSSLNTNIKFLARLKKVLSSYILTIFMTFFAFVMFMAIFFSGRISISKGPFGDFVMED